jgi:hypothetical protein
VCNSGEHRWEGAHKGRLEGRGCMTLWWVMELLEVVEADIGDDIEL